MVARLPKVVPSGVANTPPGFLISNRDRTSTRYPLCFGHPVSRRGSAAFRRALWVVTRRDEGTEAWQPPTQVQRGRAAPAPSLRPVCRPRPD